MVWHEKQRLPKPPTAQVNLCDHAQRRGLASEPKAFCQELMAMGGGLRLERRVEPEILSPSAANQICLTTLARLVGRLG